MTQNQGLVNSALAQLGPSAQAQYSQLTSSLQGDPVAQLAGQSLVLSGQMSATDANGGTMLSTLSVVASGQTPLAQGVDPKQFVAQLTKECATPDAINQGNTEDCTSTQANILMDRLDGAEYARLATQAASPSGIVTWADGSSTARSGTPIDDRPVAAPGVLEQRRAAGGRRHGLGRHGDRPVVADVQDVQPLRSRRKTSTRTTSPARRAT